jgi:enoyl-CoA hydratase/carnithine racemase
VSLAVEGPVAVVSIERRAKLNALSTFIELELVAALNSAEVRASHCVVLTGGPEVFSAGADLSEMAGYDAGAALDYYRKSGGVYEQLASLPQPSVSAISGYCLGGGLEMALATDFRIADDSAVFGLPEVGIGILPSSGGTYRLVRAVGPAKARELVLVRPRFGAAEALSLGLVTEVVPTGGAISRALELARQLSALPPLAVSLARRAIDAATESSRDVALLVEQLAYAALSSRPGLEQPWPDPRPSSTGHGSPPRPERPAQLGEPAP